MTLKINKSWTVKYYIDLLPQQVKDKLYRLDWLNSENIVVNSIHDAIDEIYWWNCYEEIDRLYCLTLFFENILKNKN